MRLLRRILCTRADQQTAEASRRSANRNPPLPFIADFPQRIRLAALDNTLSLFLHSSHQRSSRITRRRTSKFLTERISRLAFLRLDPTIPPLVSPRSLDTCARFSPADVRFFDIFPLLFEPKFNLPACSSARTVEAREGTRVLRFSCCGERLIVTTGRPLPLNGTCSNRNRSIPSTFLLTSPSICPTAFLLLVPLALSSLLVSFRSIQQPRSIRLTGLV